MRKVYTQSQVLQATNLAKLIGDPSNILIFYELMNFGEKSFNELKRMTDINAVTLSKKLSFLKSQGLVTCREEGKEKIYSLTSKANAFEPIIKDIEDLVLNNKLKG